MLVIGARSRVVGGTASSGRIVARARGCTVASGSVTCGSVTRGAVASRAIARRATVSSSAVARSAIARGIRGAIARCSVSSTVRGGGRGGAVAVGASVVSHGDGVCVVARRRSETFFAGFFVSCAFSRRL